MTDRSAATVEISEYLPVLRRWSRRLVLVTVLGALVGAAALAVRAPDYRAEAKVVIRPLATSGDQLDVDSSRVINTTTEREIAGSQRVAERAVALLDVAADLGLSVGDPVVVEAAADRPVDAERARDLAERIEVTALANSQILRFAASAGTPRGARDTAQAMAVAYVDYRRGEALDARTTLEKDLAARIAALDDEIASLGRRAADLDPGADAVELRAIERDLEAAYAERSLIRARLVQLQALKPDPAAVLDDAELPSSSAGPPLVLGLLGGGLLAATVTAGLAFAADRLDDRLRDQRGELAAMGLPVLGAVPPPDDPDSPTGHWGSAAPSDEAYRRLQTSLLFQLDQLDVSVLLVARSDDSPGGSGVAAGLAVAAARAGRRTLVVGADLRAPRLHRWFGLPIEPGLSDVLTGTEPLGAVLRRPAGVDELMVLTAGSAGVEPSAVLRSQSVGRLVSLARDQFDLVLFESPPVLQVADAVEMARVCEAAVLVVDPDRAVRTRVAAAGDQLRRVGIEVLGSVLLEPVTARRSPRSGEPLALQVR
jgi:capsular exopolysaccharide synthesis family protein